jgi:hypothetical protein
LRIIRARKSIVVLSMQEVLADGPAAELELSR